MKKKWINHLGLCGIVFFIIHILWFSTATGSNSRPYSAVIRVENGMLTLFVKETPLIDILDKLSDQTGMGYEIYTDTGRKITANYSNIPLDEGLKRLLSPSNLIIVYSAKKIASKIVNIKKIIVYDQSGSSSDERIKRETSGSGNGRDEDRRTGTNPNKKPEKTNGIKSLEAYAEQLNDADSDIREEAVIDMADEYEEAALIYLEQALVLDGDDEVRIAAAEEIGELESEEGIEILAKGLNDPDEDVREAVVDALGEIRGEKALPVLHKALKDRNKDIREAAAELIEEIEEEVTETD